MKHHINFARLAADHTWQNRIFEDLMYGYIDEMNQHSHRPLPKQFQKKWIDSIMASQGPQDCHLELCYVADTPIGFLYGKVDHEDHEGFIKPHWGYILEFYVAPEYRRKGFGKQMLQRLEDLFRQDGAKMMYLTADPVTGKPFWEAMGFVSTGEISPQNSLPIYEKAVSAQ